MDRIVIEVSVKKSKEKAVKKIIEDLKKTGCELHVTYEENYNSSK